MSEYYKKSPVAEEVELVPNVVTDFLSAARESVIEQLIQRGLDPNDFDISLDEDSISLNSEFKGLTLIAVPKSGSGFSKTL